MAQTDLERLTFQLSADMRKMQRDLDKANGVVTTSANRMQSRLDKVSIGRGFSGQMSSLAKSSSIGSSALSAFGPAGMTAAAGIAGATLAIRGMQSALKFADDLDAMATKIGITAEQLQELTFAAHENDITTQELEGSLRGLNATLGAYKAGVGDAKVKKVFEALGITRESLKDVRNAADFLPILADKIAGLQTTAERVKIAKALGAEELVPMLEKGSEAIREQTDRARKLGLVMSDELAKDAAEASRELEIMGEYITSHLNIAFANLGVWIVDVTKKLGPLISSLKEFQKRSAAAVAEAFPESKVGSRTAYTYGMARIRARDRGDTLPSPAEIRAESARGPQSRGRNRAALGIGSGPVAPSGGGGGDTGGGGGGGGGGRSRAASKPRWGGALPDYIRTAISQGRFTEASIREEFPNGDFPIPMAVLEELMRADVSGGYDGTEIFARDIEQNPDLSNAPGALGGGGAIMSQERYDEIQGGVYDSIRGGLEAGFQDGIPGVMQYLAQALQQTILDSVARSLTEAFMGQVSSSGIGAAVAGLFGFRAAGGTVSRGRPYIVGEKGPELMVPGASGTVIPNNALRGVRGMSTPSRGGGVTIIQPFHLHAEGAVMTAELLQSMDRRSKANAAMGAQAAIMASKRGYAATQARFQLLGST